MQGAMTAIARSFPPEPLKWLYERGLIYGRTLDYGSGRGCWYDMTCYDPHWRPGYPTGKYDTITCIYVLNVVPAKVEFKIVKDIKDLLKLGGIAYFAVRRDLPREGKAGRGIWQRYVELPMELISETRTRAIYAMRRNQR
jgi:ATP adenylyltransferase